MTRTKEDVLRQIDEAGVRYIRLCFTDILGKIKGMSITRVAFSCRQFFCARRIN